MKRPRKVALLIETSNAYARAASSIESAMISREGSEYLIPA